MCEIDAFVRLLTDKVQTYYTQHYPKADYVEFRADRLQKRVRIVKLNAPGDRNGSAYCFIDPGTGDIFKPDGFKRPAKQARGNIRSADPLACCGPHGVAYLR